MACGGAVLCVEPWRLCGGSRLHASGSSIGGALYGRRDDAACLRACVQKGSKYALVVGEKVYTLDVKDKATLDALDKLAASKATVKGAANGDTIEVSSVAAAK